jgi:solute:Na+ symporter, SSS family
MLVWIPVTYFTGPESRQTLESFYRRVRPGGPGWAAISVPAGYGREPIPGGALAWSNWIAGIIAVYATLFGIGKLIFGDTALGLGMLGVAVLAFAWIARSFRTDDAQPAPAPKVAEAYAGD